MKNEATNVDHKDMKCTANMIVTYPGKEKIEVVTKNGIDIREYLQKDTLTFDVTKNTERELRAYLAKYNPEKLKEYEKAKEAKDEGR